MSNSNQQLFNRIDAILDGIDRQEDDPRGGWWHTEDGARVGRIKLWELKEAIQEHLITVAGTACAGAAKPEPLPVDLAALRDPDFSDGLSSIEHLNRLSGVAPSRPAQVEAAELVVWILREAVHGPSADEWRLAAKLLQRLSVGSSMAEDVESTNAQPAAIAQQAEVDQLTPKEVEAQECFTALRDEILNLNDGLEVNEVLRIIDNHTPEWV
jgi:hypothetical protein